MVKVLIIDDHVVVRDGVKSVFNEQTDSVCFGEASAPQEALQLVHKAEWDVVVLDISLGGRNGLELLKDIKQLRPKLPVLILSMHAEEQYAQRAFKAGAGGYITKDCSRADLFEAINKVLNGGRYVSPALAEKSVIDTARDVDKPRHEGLSDREFEVLCMIASGKTLSEIASSLGLSDKTISTYRARLMDKMGMKTNAELIHYAINQKLVG